MTTLLVLLGEYTCIEVELSDDETVHSTTDQPSATCSKTYKCSECPKTNSSISGLRGHLNNNNKKKRTFSYMSLLRRKPAFCICENKDRSPRDREADQRLCFRYMFKDSTIPLLSKSEISSL